MLRLLQIEFIKLKNSRASRNLIIIYFILLLSLSLFSTIKFNIGQFDIHIADQGIYNFPFIWHFNTFMAGLFKIFLFLVIVSMTANEYSNRTLKQNLIDGLSKKEFILSKFYMVVTFAFISTLFVFVVSLILGLVYSDFQGIDIVFLDIQFLIAYFIKLVGFFSFGLFLGVLIKKSAFAVSAMAVWFFIENIIYGLLTWELNDIISVKAGQIMQFFPLHAMYNLIDQPIKRFKAVKSIANQLEANLTYDYAVHWYEIVIVLIWIFLFLFFSYKLLKKRDL